MKQPGESTLATPTFTSLVLFGCLTVVGCASVEPVPDPENITVSEAKGKLAQSPSPGTPAEPDEGPEQAFIDRKQQLVANVVNNTAFWFDGLFATSEIYPQDAMTSGRILLGSRWDERDGLKNRIRIGLRVPLPALRKRAKLIVGRSDTDDLLDGTESTEIKAIPDKFNDTKDEDWFLGLGYRQKSGLASGFDAGVGVTFASGTVQPYVQANYRWNATIGDDWLSRVSARLLYFAQSRDLSWHPGRSRL